MYIHRTYASRELIDILSSLGFSANYKEVQGSGDNFEELLNRPAPSNPPDIPLASEVLEVNCERPDREEIRKAISLLKTGKAPGPDEIPAKAIKADMETSIEMLYDLIGKIWDTDEIPIGWKEGYLVKIPKKGDLHECKNYRGIMLLSVPGKVFNRIILERLKMRWITY